MDKLWFKWRDPEEGCGYKVASIEGWISIGVMAIVICAVTALPVALGATLLVGLIITMVSVAVSLGCFMAVVRKRSDWRG